MAPSSSGPGYLVLIQKIAGSNPAGVTKEEAHPDGWAFCLVILVENGTCEAGALERNHAHLSAIESMVERRSVCHGQMCAIPQGSPSVFNLWCVADLVCGADQANPGLAGIEF